MKDLGKQFGLLKVGFADLVPSDVTLDLEDTTPEKIIHGDEIPCGEKPCVVGFGGPESEIVQRLIDDEKELKVVSVLGPGGLARPLLLGRYLKTVKPIRLWSYCICWPVPIYS